MEVPITSQHVAYRTFRLGKLDCRQPIYLIDKVSVWEENDLEKRKCFFKRSMRYSLTITNLSFITDYTPFKELGVVDKSIGLSVKVQKEMLPSFFGMTTSNLL